MDRTSLTHITLTRSFVFSGKPDDQWLPGFNASHESASPHKEPPVTQNPPRRASGVSPGYCEANPRSTAWYRPSLRTLCAQRRFPDRVALITALLPNGLTIPFSPSRTPSCTLRDFLRRWDCRKDVGVGTPSIDPSRQRVTSRSFPRADDRNLL